jgi:hypothetical protein
MMRVAKMRCIAIAVLLLTIVVVGGAAICLGHATLTVARTPYPEGTQTDSYGREVVAVEVGGKPPAVKAPAADVPLPDIAAGINSLLNVPAFDWSYGCSATSAAMLFGYYDRTGYSNMYTGPTNGGVCPLDNSIWGDTVYPSITCHECPLSGTHLGVDGRAIKGHVDDYWIDYLNADPDPYVGNWPEHAQGSCTGDFMGTNQSKFGAADGSTWFWFYPNGDPRYDYTGGEPAKIDGCHGMKDFAVSRGYAVQTNFNQLIQGQGSDPAKGFTFSQYVAEIDAGRPVLIQVEGHTMLGYGYNTTGNVVYVRDTWDHISHQMTWGSTYSSMQHYGVTVIRLSYSATTTVGTSGLVASYPATVHYVQAGVSKTATTYGTWSEGVDYGSTVSIDNAVAVSSTERYSTNAATSWLVTETATHSVPYYRQIKPTVAAVAAGTGHTDLNSTNFATLTYYRFGSAGTLNMFDAQSFNDWIDAGSTASLSNSSSASTLTHRWYCRETTSWTVNDAGSHSVTYWDQFKPAISVVTDGSVHTDLDSTNSATLTCSRFGAAATSSVFDGLSFNDWVDTGSTAALSVTSSASTSTHRWYAPGTISWVVTDAGARSATYWEQSKPTISVVTAGTGHTDLDAANCATLTYYRYGAAGTSNVFDAQSFIDWVDVGSTASVSNASSASTSTHRWYSSETTSWVVNDVGSWSATYREQFKATLALTGLASSHPVAVSVVQDGTTHSSDVSDSWSDWADVGSALRVSSLVTLSPEERYVTYDKTSWTASSVMQAEVKYTRQFLATIAITGLSQSHPTTVVFVQDRVTKDLPVTHTWSDWVDADSYLSIDRSVEGGWVGDWSTRDQIGWTASHSVSPTVHYQRSHVGVYILVGALLAGAMMISVGMFFLLRIRRKGRSLRD